MKHFAIVVGILLFALPALAQRLTVGNSHACVIRGDGTVRCFGADNANGKLGNGTTKDTWGAVTVKNISDAQQIIAGSGHTCVLHASGSVSCWGNTRADVLVPPPTEADVCYEDAAARRRKMGLPCTPTPKPVSGLGPVRLLGGNSIFHTFILQQNGDLYCLDHSGYKGDPILPRPPLVRLGNISNIVAISSMRNASGCTGGACVLNSAGEVRCFDASVILGTDAAGNSLIDSLDSPGGMKHVVSTGVASIAAPPMEAGVFTVLQDGDVYHIGVGYVRLTGARLPSLDATERKNGQRTKLSELSGVKSIAYNHTGGCALLLDGQVKCWGDRQHFTLGDGKTKGPGNMPVLVKGITDAVELGISQAVSPQATTGFACLPRCRS